KGAELVGVAEEVGLADGELGGERLQLARPRWRGEPLEETANAARARVGAALERDAQRDVVHFVEVQPEARTDEAAQTSELFRLGARFHAGPAAIRCQSSSDKSRAARKSRSRRASRTPMASITSGRASCAKGGASASVARSIACTPSTSS